MSKRGREDEEWGAKLPRLYNEYLVDSEVQNEHDRIRPTWTLSVEPDEDMDEQAWKSVFERMKEQFPGVHCSYRSREKERAFHKNTSAVFVIHTRFAMRQIRKKVLFMIDNSTRVRELLRADGYRTGEIPIQLLHSDEIAYRIPSHRQELDSYIRTFNESHFNDLQLSINAREELVLWFTPQKLRPLDRS